MNRAPPDLWGRRWGNRRRYPDGSLLRYRIIRRRCVMLARKPCRDGGQGHLEAQTVDRGDGPSDMKGQWYRSYGKRILDLAVAISGLLLFSPLLVLVAVLVRLKLGSPVLFRHQRAGLHGQPFTLYKFRSMTNQRDAEGKLLPDAQRLTRFGRFLRSSSLDELPELVKMVSGAMSVVGPRPLLLEYLDRYTPEQMRRHEVTSGITGWAQVNGRNTTT